jgi:cytochrome c oxidase subunit 2
VRRIPTPTGVLLIAALFLGACSSTWGAPESASDQGDDITRLWRLFAPLALVIGALVWGLILWSILRYRRRSDDAGLPPQTRENLPLEVLYTAVPLVIVGVLFTTTYITHRRVDRLSPRPDVVIEVEGFKWQWRFRYVREGVSVVGLPDRPPELNLPVGKTARLMLTSRDVVHSFYVPRFLYKRDAIPGMTNRFDITPSRLGVHRGACYEFCGLRHDDMLFTVRVLPAAEFSAWVEDQKRGMMP